MVDLGRGLGRSAAARTHGATAPGGRVTASSVALGSAHGALGDQDQPPTAASAANVPTVTTTLPGTGAADDEAGIELQAVTGKNGIDEPKPVAGHRLADDDWDLDEVKTRKGLRPLHPWPSSGERWGTADDCRTAGGGACPLPAIGHPEGCHTDDHHSKGRSAGLRQTLSAAAAGATWQSLPDDGERPHPRGGSARPRARRAAAAR
ncbi:hypothetical protein [Actinocorallia lasiicapitis]